MNLFLRYLAFMLAALALAGCAEYPARYDLLVMDLVVGTPAQVDKHCRKDGSPYDNGHPVMPGDIIRACSEFKNVEKPAVVISRKYRKCSKHEACHALQMDTPENCAKMYPCLGEAGAKQ